MCFIRENNSWMNRIYCFETNICLTIDANKLHPYEIDCVLFISESHIFYSLAFTQIIKR